MSERFAQILSYLLHPAVIPSLGTAFLLWIVPMYVSETLFYYTLGFMMLSTYILPGIFSMLLRHLGLIKSLHMTEARDRRYPFLISIAFFLFAANALRNWPVPSELVHLLIASAITILIFYLLLRWTKWSVHLAGMGGITALIIYASRHYEIELLSWIALSVALSGLLATARLRLSAHTPVQIFMGYATGFTVTMLCLTLLSSRI